MVLAQGILMLFAKLSNMLLSGCKMLHHKSPCIRTQYIYVWKEASNYIPLQTIHPKSKILSILVCRLVSFPPINGIHRWHIEKEKREPRTKQTENSLAGTLVTIALPLGSQVAILFKFGKHKNSQLYVVSRSSERVTVGHLQTARL